MNYPPAHHQESDFKNVIEVVKNYPFATLVTAQNNKPFITHIPIVYEDDGSTYGKLVAHIDKYNPQVETLTNGSIVTSIFYGPNCYISPSTYSTRQLPTWNYIFAHLQGKISLIPDQESVKRTMVRMTSFLEGSDPRYVLALDDSRMDAMVNYIVGFEIEITHWEGKFKFSQDKNKKDQELAKQELIRSQQNDISEFVDRIFTNHKNAQKSTL